MNVVISDVAVLCCGGFITLICIVVGSYWAIKSCKSWLESIIVRVLHGVSRHSAASDATVVGLRDEMRSISGSLVSRVDKFEDKFDRTVVALTTSVDAGAKELGAVAKVGVAITGHVAEAKAMFCLSTMFVLYGFPAYVVYSIIKRVMEKKTLPLENESASEKVAGAKKWYLSQLDKIVGLVLLLSLSYLGRDRIKLSLSKIHDVISRGIVYLQTARVVGSILVDNPGHLLNEIAVVDEAIGEVLERVEIGESQLEDEKHDVGDDYNKAIAPVLGECKCEIPALATVRVTPADLCAHCKRVDQRLIAIRAASGRAGHGHPNMRAFAEVIVPLDEVEANERRTIKAYLTDFGNYIGSHKEHLFAAGVGLAVIFVVAWKLVERQRSQETKKETVGKCLKEIVNERLNPKVLPLDAADEGGILHFEYYPHAGDQSLSGQQRQLDLVDEANRRKGKSPPSQFKNWEEYNRYKHDRRLADRLEDRYNLNDVEQYEPEDDDVSNYVALGAEEDPVPASWRKNESAIFQTEKDCLVRLYDLKKQSEKLAKEIRIAKTRMEDAKAFAQPHLRKNESVGELVLGALAFANPISFVLKNLMSSYSSYISVRERRRNNIDRYVERIVELKEKLQDRGISTAPVPVPYYNGYAPTVSTRMYPVYSEDDMKYGPKISPPPFHSESRPIVNIPTVYTTNRQFQEGQAYRERFKQQKANRKYASLKSRPAPPCNEWSRTTMCGSGASCPFSHDPSYVIKPLPVEKKLDEESSLGKTQHIAKFMSLAVVYPTCVKGTPEEDRVWSNATFVSNGLVFPDHVMAAHRGCKTITVVQGDEEHVFDIGKARKIVDDILFLPDVKMVSPTLSRFKMAAMMKFYTPKKGAVDLAFLAYNSVANARKWQPAISSKGAITSVEDRGGDGILVTHTVPTFPGQCGAPMVDADGRAYGIHRWGGEFANQFRAFTKEMILQLQPNFQSAPRQ